MYQGHKKKVLLSCLTSCSHRVTDYFIISRYSKIITFKNVRNAVKLEERAKCHIKACRNGYCCQTLRFKEVTHSKYGHNNLNSTISYVSRTLTPDASRLWTKLLYKWSVSRHCAAAVSLPISSVGFFSMKRSHTEMNIWVVSFEGHSPWLTENTATHRVMTSPPDEQRQNH